MHRDSGRGVSQGGSCSASEKYQMTASDKNRKTKRANKMLAVTKAVEIKWAAKAETLSWKQKAAKAKAGQRQSSWGRADVIVLLELLPLMFSENLHIMIRADTKLKQKVGEREREEEATVDDIGTWQRPRRDQQRLSLCRLSSSSPSSSSGSDFDFSCLSCCLLMLRNIQMPRLLPPLCKYPSL